MKRIWFIDFAFFFCVVSLSRTFFFYVLYLLVFFPSVFVCFVVLANTGFQAVLHERCRSFASPSLFAIVFLISFSLSSLVFVFNARMGKGWLLLCREDVENFEIWGEMKTVRENCIMSISDFSKEKTRKK